MCVTKAQYTGFRLQAIQLHWGPQVATLLHWRWQYLVGQIDCGFWSLRGMFSE